MTCIHTSSNSNKSRIIIHVMELKYYIVILARPVKSRHRELEATRHRCRKSLMVFLTLFSPFVTGITPVCDSIYESLDNSP